MNLILNANKFIDNGEIRIVALHDSDRRQTVFTVADTGIGTAPEELPFVSD